MFENTHSKLRAQIRAGRELIGLSQKDLATHLGVSYAKISKAETGETKTGDVLLEIKGGLERLGIVFTKNGVEFSQNHIELIEGEGCYLQLLHEVHRTLISSSEKELLIMFASDAISPPQVNEQYKFMRRHGITMRQIVKKGDNYIIGPLNEYRAIPEKYFTNIVTLVYGNCVAQVNGDETRIIVQKDSKLAERERRVFN